MTITRYAGNTITCDSTDTKPTNIPDGARCFVLNTNEIYVKKSGSWYITAVSQSVYNDIVDHVECEENPEYGFVYVIDKNGKAKKASTYCEKGIIGISSDTYGYSLGFVEERKHQVPICIGGFALAHVEQIYDPGTPLTSGEGGKLLEMQLRDKITYPERLVGIFYRIEPGEIWNKTIVVNNRHWVKVL